MRLSNKEEETYYYFFQFLQSQKYFVFPASKDKFISIDYFIAYLENENPLALDIIKDFIRNQVIKFLLENGALSPNKIIIENRIYDNVRLYSPAIIDKIDIHISQNSIYFLIILYNRLLDEKWFSIRADFIEHLYPKYFGDIIFFHILLSQMLKRQQGNFLSQLQEYSPFNSPLTTLINPQDMLPFTMQNWEILFKNPIFAYLQNYIINTWLNWEQDKELKPIEQQRKWNLLQNNLWEIIFKEAQRLSIYNVFSLFITYYKRLLHYVEDYTVLLKIRERLSIEKINQHTREEILFSFGNLYNFAMRIDNLAKQLRQKNFIELELEEKLFIGQVSKELTPILDKLNFIYREFTQTIG